MRTSFADETGSIQTRDTNAVNPAQKAKRLVFGNLEWQQPCPEAMLPAWPGGQGYRQKETGGGFHAEDRGRGACGCVFAAARRGSSTSVPVEADQVRHSLRRRARQPTRSPASPARSWSRRSASPSSSCRSPAPTARWPPARSSARRPTATPSCSAPTARSPSCRTCRRSRPTTSSPISRRSPSSARTPSSSSSIRRCPRNARRAHRLCQGQSEAAELCGRQHLRLRLDGDVRDEQRHRSSRRSATSRSPMRIADLLSGRVHLMNATSTSVAAAREGGQAAGRSRRSFDERSPLMPDVPSIIEAGQRPSSRSPRGSRWSARRPAGRDRGHA